MCDNIRLNGNRNSSSNEPTPCEAGLAYSSPRYNQNSVPTKHYTLEAAIYPFSILTVSQPQAGLVYTTKTCFLLLID